MTTITELITLNPGFYAKEENHEESLEGLKLGRGKKEVSVIIATHNRCPKKFSSESRLYNPLEWCLNSLTTQNNSPVKEVIVVDDGSSDNTASVLDGWKENYLRRETTKDDTLKESSLKKSLLTETNLLNVKIIKNEKRLGSPKSRNLGLKEAASETVFLCDDDCIFSENSLAGNYTIFSYLRDKDRNCAALQLPYYEKSNFPREAVPSSEIGKLDVKNGKYSTNLKRFPLEYVFAPRTIEKGAFPGAERFYLPLPIEHLVGIILADKKALLEAGGFPEYFSWRNAFGEEAELSLNLLEQGKKLFFNPDPKLYAVHLKYGGEGISEINPKSYGGISLEKMLSESRKLKSGSGNRTSSEDWLYSKIISYFVIFLKRNEEGAEKWLEQTYNDFVLQNIPEFSGNRFLRVGLEERHSIWKKAIDEGIRIVQELEMRSKRENTRRVQEHDACYL